MIKTIIKKCISCTLIVAFIGGSLCTPGYGQAQQIITPALLNLPSLDASIGFSPSFSPMVIRGLRIDPVSPFEFQFLMDSGDTRLTDTEVEEESNKLIRYFLTSLAIPEDDMWVNLSPYESDRVIPETFSRTEMGINLLSQDYILKQFTANLLNPETETGQDFWQRANRILKNQYGDADIPLNTFNKVWIVPQSGRFIEESNTVIIADTKLSVMLESDYVAMQRNLGAEEYGLTSRKDSDALTEQTKQLMREFIIPEIEYEVNNGENFAPLRQIYNSMLLSVWFKKRLNDHVMASEYGNSNNINGISVPEGEQRTSSIWNQYRQAFEQGAFEGILENYDPVTQEMTNTLYFSGGAVALKELDTTRFSDRMPEFDRIVNTNILGDAAMVSGDNDDQTTENTTPGESENNRRITRKHVKYAVLGAGVLAVGLMMLLSDGSQEISTERASVEGPQTFVRPTTVNRSDFREMDFNSALIWFERYIAYSDTDLRNLNAQQIDTIFRFADHLENNGFTYVTFNQAEQSEVSTLINRVSGLADRIISVKGLDQPNPVDGNLTYTQDNAMLSENVGGINLRSDQAQLTFQSSGNGFTIPAPDTLINDFSSAKFSPTITQIISISPPTNTSFR